MAVAVAVAVAMTVAMAVAVAVAMVVVKLAVAVAVAVAVVRLCSSIRSHPYQVPLPNVVRGVAGLLEVERKELVT